MKPRPNETWQSVSQPGIAGVIVRVTEKKNAEVTIYSLHPWINGYKTYPLIPFMRSWRPCAPEGTCR